MFAVRYLLNEAHAAGRTKPDGGSVVVISVIKKRPRLRGWSRVEQLMQRRD